MIAVSSEGPLLTDMIDPRFGRAAGFVIANSANEQLKYIDNGASQVLAHGAGIETTVKLAKEGVQVVLSGFVGPKAFQALQAAGIQVCQDVQGMTVGEALTKYHAGEFPFAQAPNK
jgi:predicted Fe-Mo cluster-binding NifX family protein